MVKTRRKKYITNDVMYLFCISYRLQMITRNRK
ncbi:hypothetical protein HNR39_000467 [Glaciimonas immobilis]|uniref:Uncharacterized protein n=1 Tax=Glaciimonas immobilis TaxID=728004 RepID=A0A840RKC4_9BURK|nr:hypothetical protein [Glaciimonas immobilis]